MKKNRIVNNTIKYEEKYSKIIVTYHDNVTKDFLPYQWAIFEKGIRKIAKKIEFIEKELTIKD